MKKRYRNRYSKFLFLVLFWTLLISLRINVFADSSSYSISETSMTFYLGDVIEKYTNFSPDPLSFEPFWLGTTASLNILNNETVCPGVQWRSSNTSVAKVDARGGVEPVGYGTATITGTYGGRSFNCTVYVKEIRFYFWLEYTGDQEHSHWAWYSMCCPAVGQSVPYKLIEITYGTDQKEVSRRDVTSVYTLSAECPDYIQIEEGRIKALKPGSNQDDGTSGVYFVFDNTGVSYVQMIRFHVFTSDRFEKEFIKNLSVLDDGSTLSLRPAVYAGIFTNDDEFIVDGDWSFYGYTTKELTWKSLTEDLVTIDQIRGSEPNHVYSTIWYSVHKSGTARVAVLLDGKEIKTYSFAVEKYGDPEDSEDPGDSNHKKEHQVTREGNTSYAEPGWIYNVSGMQYEVTHTDSSGKGTATFAGAVKDIKRLTRLTVPATVKIKGKTFKVTAIADNVCKGCKKLKSVTIGKNVKAIGKNAFRGARKLKRINIKSKKLTFVGKNAIKGIYKKAKIKVPKKKLKKYKKLFSKKTGFKKTMKIRR